MALLLTLLGTFDAYLEDLPIRAFESAKVRALLAYLAVEADRPHSREKLAGLFWGETSDEAAARNLRQALSNLRKAIQDNDEKPALTVTSSAIQANPSDNFKLDVNDFEALIAAARAHPHRRAETCPACAMWMEKALTLYRGEFLQGFLLKDADSFQDWLMIRRENLHIQAVEAVQNSLRYQMLRGDFQAALNFARRLVEMDPWREESQVALIELLARAGQRSAALKQYETCRSILETELGIEPQENTTHLYQQIRDGKLPDLPPHLPPQNLPTELTSFVGRKSKLEQLADYLQRADCHLVTLVGPGGAGKTRLAIQAARDASITFPDGAYWVNLSSVDDPQSLPLAIADSFGIPFPGSKNPRAQLLDFLRQKEILLVLDNFEHLLDGADLVAEILRETGNVTILVTSREPLRLQAEWLLPVGGLSFSSRDNRSATVKPEAAQLYEARARRVAPSFALTPETLPPIINLCQLLDGLPLGIELAAATARQFTPDQIYEKVSQNMGFLSSQMRDVPERHRSLQAVFEYSWNLLTPDEQTVLRRLSVFRGGFNEETAHIIAGASLQMLITLADKSLIQQPAHERYEMHEIVRQFAAEKLTLFEDERNQTLSTHSQHFLQWIQGNELSLKTADRLALKITADEIDNIRLAWDWACAHRRLDLLELALDALMQFYDARNRYTEGESAIREALEALNPPREQPAGSSPGWMRLYGKLLGYSGWMSQRRGLFDQSRQSIEECLQIVLELGDEVLIRTWKRKLGYMAYLQSNYDEAVRYTQDALKSARLANDVLDIQDCLNNLGLVANHRGEHEQAKEFFKEWLAYPDNQNTLGRIYAFINLGLAHFYLGEYEAARTHFQEAVSLSELVENRMTLGLAVTNLGILEKVNGNLEQATAHFQQALEIQTEIGNRFNIAANVGNLASTLDESGQHEQAQVQHLRALEILRDIKNPWGVALVLNNLADNALLRGDLSASSEYLQEGLPLSLKIDAAPLTIAGLFVAAELLRRKGETRQAVELVAFVLGFDDLDSENIEAGEKLWQSLTVDLPSEEENALREHGKLSAQAEGALAKMTTQLLDRI